MTKYNYEYDKEWKKQNTVQVVVRMMKTTDKDLVERLESVKSKMGEVKRLMRLGLKYEEEHPDTAVEAETEE